MLRIRLAWRRSLPSLPATLGRSWAAGGGPDRHAVAWAGPTRWSSGWAASLKKVSWAWTGPWRGGAWGWGGGGEATRRGRPDEGGGGRGRGGGGGRRRGGERRAGAEPFGHPVPIQDAHPDTDPGI